MSYFTKSTIITTYRGLHSKEHGKDVSSMSKKCEIELVDKHQKDCSSVDLSLNGCLAAAAKKAAFSLCTSINAQLPLQESRT
jgi:hypothetical protein